MADADAILARREARAREQAALLRGADAVVSFTVVAPGPDKDAAACRLAFDAGLAALAPVLAGREVGRVEVGLSTGPELLVAVTGDPHALKRELVALEDAAPLGRLWDVDVVVRGASGGPTPVGRAELGLGPRRCLACERPARECGRARRHPLPVLEAARDAVAAGADLAQGQRLADLACAALRVEARLTPKPGLVDAASPGAHDDMDLPLLERSADALRDWFLGAWCLGASGAATDAIVRLGVQAEAAMRAATGGVNTHKGALFAFGLVLAGFGEVGASAGVAAALTASAVHGRRLLEAWVAQPDESHGATAWRELGLTGARGEAASGFATVTGAGLPALGARQARYGDDADALRWALVTLMARHDDTNLVARGGAAGLRDVEGWAAEIVAADPDPDRLHRALATADLWFTERRLSPGGSADLLALTWFLARA